MALPFTTEQFFHVFERYNTVIWPVQLIAYGLGAGAVALCLFRSIYADMTLGGILAFLWLWIGAAVAFLFAALFIVQGVLLQWEGVLRKRLSFRIRWDLAGAFGGLLVLYAMVVYPLIGHLAGHEYPRSASFGVTPCPTTIFTLGLLLWARRRVPRYLLVIPLLWALIGSYAALALGVYEDLGLLAAAAIAVPLIIRQERRLPAAAETAG